MTRQIGLRVFVEGCRDSRNLVADHSWGLLGIGGAAWADGIKCCGGGLDSGVAWPSGVTEVA